MVSTLAVTVSCWLVTSAAAEVPAAATEVPLAFADALLTEGDHYRAIGEYKRFLFLNPSGAEADHARFSVGLAYRRGGQAQAAIEQYQRITRERPELRRQALLEEGYTQYLAGADAEAAGSLTEWLRAEPTEQTPEVARARYLLGWTQLSLGHPDVAASQFQALPDFPGRKALVRETLAMVELPTKSPWIAGLLAVVPGAGHLYLGQPLIGLAALLWNGLFAFATYGAFRQGNLGVGLVLGVFESLWYLGSIFGAISGAQKYNRDVRLNALEALRSSHEDHLEAWPPSR